MPNASDQESLLSSATEYRTTITRALNTQNTKEHQKKSKLTQLAATVARMFSIMQVANSLVFTLVAPSNIRSKS